ncbi:MAG TPA: saccharopine dehydrogenase C-terminal domain-containing protein [Actinomycetota bacterium]|nr:saccharopine dehydrogenase C-terminal domain-containing protein [Actinomycetota bacterium]
MGARVAVLGAGAMGSATAALLARHRAEVDLLVLDADPGRAEAVVRRVGHGEARAVDAAAGGLAEALRGARAVASCLPYRLNLAVMEAALAAGCHYADLGGLFHTTRAQLELDGRFREAGLSAVLGIGSAPGLTNVLARLGADRLDRVVSIDMVDGSVDVGEERFAVPYSAETILDEFTLPAMVFEGGELREVPAGSGVVEWTFPEPVGTQPAMYTLHSELATLPSTIPGVRDVRWRLALPRAVHDGFRLFVDVGLASTEPVETPHGPAVPREVLVAVLSALPAPEGPPRDVEYLDVRVAGERDGRPATHVALARFDPSPEGLSAGAFGTALPIAIAARWMAEGRVEPGVHPPETAFDPVAFVAECEREGVRVSTELREAG